MATDVVMPQMGESIAEGTIVRWIKKGRRQGRSRRAAVRDLDRQGGRRNSLAGRRRPHRDSREGRRDGPGQQRGRRDWRGKRRRPRASARAAPPARPSAPSPAPPRRQPTGAAPALASRRPPAPGARRTAARHRRRAPSADTNGGTSGQGEASTERSSPLVRKIAKEHHVDISQIHGTGIAGRVTKDDILGFIGGQEADRRARRRPRSGAASTPQAAAPVKLECAGFQAGRLGSRREDVGDAEEDRRAHGAEPADVGARALGVRGELLARRADPRTRRRPSTSAPARSSPTCRSSSRRRSTRCARCRSSTPRSTATTSSITRTSTSASRSRSTGA